METQNIIPLSHHDHDPLSLRSMFEKLYKESTSPGKRNLFSRKMLGGNRKCLMFVGLLSKVSRKNQGNFGHFCLKFLLIIWKVSKRNCPDRILSGIKKTKKKSKNQENSKISKFQTFFNNVFNLNGFFPGIVLASALKTESFMARPVVFGMLPPF
jgi:hypothetical protein